MNTNKYLADYNGIILIVDPSIPVAHVHGISDANGHHFSEKSYGTYPIEDLPLIEKFKVLDYDESKSITTNIFSAFPVLMLS